MRRWIWEPTIVGCWWRGRPRRDSGSSTRSRASFGLGEGLSLTGRLSEAAIARTLEALKVCRDKMAARGVTRARTIATEACRSAANGADFVAVVRERLGIELEIVDRETEAHLAAAGVGDLADKDARSTVMFDIGGGSSEIIWLAFDPRAPQTTNGVKAWESLRLGVVSLAEMFGGVDVSEEAFAAMTAYVSDALAPFVARVADEARCDRFHLLGTSGTVTTIAGVHLNLPRYDRRAVDGLWLGRAEVDAAITRLRAMSYAERAANACIGHERADLVLAGCAILEAIRATFPRRAAAHRRPGPARGNPQSHDARRRGRSAPPPARALVTTGGSGREGGRALKTRVKMTRKRTPASARWLERQLNDPYVAQARREGYRSRAAYKLIEIDDKHKLLKPGGRIVDLGAAPGGWSQVAAARTGASQGRGRVIAIDLLEMDTVEGVEFRQMDFHDRKAPGQLREWLGGLADGVLSDMAANATGHRKTDQLRIVGLVELAADFASEVWRRRLLSRQGLQGGAEGELLARLKRDFATVRHLKPKASRADSAELYLLATGSGAAAV